MPDRVGLLPHARRVPAGQWFVFAGVVEPVEGEDPEEVRALALAALISNPRRMRHMAGIQAAAWAAVEERVEDA